MMIRTQRACSGGFLLTLVFAFSVSSCTQQPDGEPGAEGEPTVAGQELSESERLLVASARVALPPALDPADLPDPQSPGAQAVGTYCSSCHALPHPAMHAATDWPDVTRRMWLRMELLGPEYTVAVPSSGDRVVILDYLRAHAFQVNQASLPDAPGRDAFESTCSQCHDLPDPRQHSADDWLTVVRRMNEHMRAILGSEITPTQVEEVVRYLEVASTSQG
jgi:cytochrome c5